MSILASHSPIWQGFQTYSPLKKIAFYLYVLGGFGCLVFFIISILSKNWVNVGTSGSMVVLVLIAFYYFEQLDVDILFGVISIGGLVATMVGISFNAGLNDSGMQAIYPIFLMIGMAFRKRPRLLLAISSATIVWVVFLFILDSQGVYLNSTEPLTGPSKAIFMVVMIFLMTGLLQVTLQNLLAANSKLEIANEEAIAAKITAESANLAKNRFLATMSHELRTPLNAIIGYSEMIAEDSEGEIESDASKIQKSASNLLGVINSILEISRIEAGELDMKLEDVLVSSLLKDLEDILSHHFFQSKNQLIIEPLERPLFVFADRQKLRQILINLVSNANKFTQNGEVNLRVMLKDGGKISFEVADTGIGIDPNNIEAVFFPFHQVENSLNRQYAGAGLGLSICKQYTQAMNGELTVESELGKGSTFTLNLPAGYQN